MSFTSNIKSELTKLETPTCCKISECYGILLFGRAFSEKEISVSTENEEVVERISHLLSSCFGAQPHISGGGTKRDYFTITIDNEQKCTEILNSLGYFGFELGDSVIKYQNIEDNDKKIIGEIVDIDQNNTFIKLVGEYENDNFVFGISKKPSFKSIFSGCGSKNISCSFQID